MVLDTSKEARMKQIEIILSKTSEERAMMGVDMIDTTYNLIKNVFLQENPEISKGELIAKIFYRYYKNDFQHEELELIMRRIKTTHSLV